MAGIEFETEKAEEGASWRPSSLFLDTASYLSATSYLYLAGLN